MPTKITVTHNLQPFQSIDGNITSYSVSQPQPLLLRRATPLTSSKLKLQIDISSNDKGGLLGACYYIKEGKPKNPGTLIQRLEYTGWLSSYPREIHMTDYINLSNLVVGVYASLEIIVFTRVGGGFVSKSISCQYWSFGDFMFKLEKASKKKRSPKRK
jgi:hypothetical protein